MEMKGYQKKVIADLVRYLELLNETRNYAVAFRFFWQEKSAPSLALIRTFYPASPTSASKFPQAAARPFLPVMPFARFSARCL